MLRHVAVPGLAILGAAALLVWPALANGYPILFVDTVAYLLHGITGEVPWDKTAAYGLFLAALDGGVTLWVPLAAQGLILSWLLWLTQRVACGAATPLRHLLLSAALALLTAAPWASATLMPDAFTPAVVLALYLLGFGEERLNRAETIGAGAIAALAIAVHLSHLPTACALIALVLALRRRWRPVLRAALPVAAAILFLLLANWHAFGRPTLSAHGSVFLLARLQADGPAAWTIRDRCPQAGWYLCAFADRMPMDSDHFLWNPLSPPALRPNGAVLLAPEAQAIVLAALRDHPWAVAQAALRNTVAQLLKPQIGDTLDNADLPAFANHDVWRGFPPEERERAESSLQMRGRLEALAAPFRLIHPPVLMLALAAAILALARLREDAPRRALLLCVLAGLAANAFATGALSKPHDRYQSRIVWLLPMAAALALLPRSVQPVRWPRRTSRGSRPSTGPISTESAHVTPAVSTTAGPLGRSRWKESSSPHAADSAAMPQEEAAMPPTWRDQCRAATAGSIISPTAISVPSAWNAASRFSTTRPRNTRCHAPPRAPAARAKAGSKHSSTSGRQAKAMTNRVRVATPAISSSAASSMPSTLPNSRWVSSAPPPRSVISPTPKASASR